MTVFLFVEHLVLRTIDAWVPAPFEDFLSFVVVDVESQKFLAQVQALAAVFDALVVLVDLEEEKNVVFIDFTVSVIVL